MWQPIATDSAHNINLTHVDPKVLATITDSGQQFSSIDVLKKSLAINDQQSLDTTLSPVPVEGGAGCSKYFTPKWYHLVV